MSRSVPGCDYFFDPVDWETTYNSDLGGEATEDMHACDVKRFSRLKQLRDVFAAMVPTTYHEDGEPDEYELYWFETESAAYEAVKRGPS